MNWITFIPIIVALLVIGFFSGVEVVFVSANKFSVELRKKQGSYGGTVWSFFLEKPANFIVTTIFIINFLIVIYVFLWNDLLAEFFKYFSIENEYLVLACETIIFTVILLMVSSLFL